MTKNPIEDERNLVEIELDEWLPTVQSSYLRVENQLRKKQHLAPISRVPVRIKADPVLLNLKVWTMRYHIDLDFIFTTLLSYYKNIRKNHYIPRRIGPRPEMGMVTLGLSAKVLCGERSRQVVEEAIVKTYPNGENYKNDNRVRLQQIRPLKHLDFNSIDEMVHQYGKIMQKRQVEVNTERHLPRPWRGRNK